MIEQIQMGDYVEATPPVKRCTVPEIGMVRMVRKDQALVVFPRISGDQEDFFILCSNLKLIYRDGKLIPVEPLPPPVAQPAQESTPMVESAQWPKKKR